jgi:hypothetical protein
MPSAHTEPLKTSVSVHEEPLNDSSTLKSALDGLTIGSSTVNSAHDEPLKTLVSVHGNPLIDSTTLNSVHDESLTAGTLDGAYEKPLTDPNALNSARDEPPTQQGTLKSADDEPLTGSSTLNLAHDEPLTTIKSTHNEPLMRSDSAHDEPPANPGTSFQPRHVHIVGSVCLKSNTDVFTRLTTALPTQLKRISDGETGERDYFVFWQRGSFKPFLVNWFGERQEDPPESWTIEPINTRYDVHAFESYKEFCHLRDEGVIQKGVRFQVCLPTPVNILSVTVLPQYHSEVEPLLEAALMAAARRIQDSIPKEDLAIQWDMAIDIAFIEFSKFDTQPDWKPPYIADAWFSPVREGIIERAVRVMKCIDNNVPMGVHLCYGDCGHVHFLQPENMKLMVELANEMSTAMGRNFDWIHMPVPKDRADDAYFAPLKVLKSGPGAELVLGLAHAGDLEGTKKRIEVAGKFAETFAVSTECGMGRMKDDEFDDALQVLAAVTTA